MRSLVFRLLLIVAPLAAWMAFIRWKFGPAEDPGLGNFSAPFTGYVEKLVVAWRDVLSPDSWSLHRAVLATVIALAVQGLFFAVRWRPAERWWRVGAAFAGMMIFLSTPVWEGYPGAATRVLLPMTLAFNVLVPRGVRWLPVLLAGNLTVAASVFEFSPPTEFHEVRGPARAELRVLPKGWHGAEMHKDDRWRWAPARAELKLINTGAEPLRVTVRGETSSVAGTRQVRVMTGGRLLWGGMVGEKSVELRFGLTLPPGEAVLEFVSDTPAQYVTTDPRELAFQVANLDIVVEPASRSR